MPAARKKAAPTTAPKRVRQAIPDDNGRTLGDRLKFGMNLYARSNGRAGWEGYTQEEWIALATRAVGRDPKTNPVMTQQNLSLIMQNKSSKSDGVIAFGILLSVEAAWLQYSYGSPSLLDRMNPKK